MNLTLLKDYFEACEHAQTQLQQYWIKLAKVPTFALFRCIATKSQPALDSQLIRQFLLTFNWQTIYIQANQIQQSPKFKIHKTQSQMLPQQILDYGIELLLKQWSQNKAMTFDQFSLFVKGQNDVPNNKDKQISYPQKKLLCQCFLHQMKNLIRFQSIKKIVYHEYKNLSDLFENVTATKQISYENIQRLFLSFSLRKTQQQLKRICKRAKIPWDFNYFLKIFKRSEAKNTEFKVNYSSKRVKNFEQSQSKFFTTPRKQKFQLNQTSTKITKKHKIQQISATPSKFNISSQTKTQIQPHTYIQILADLLELQQKFVNQCSQLIKRSDFDLQLVYQRHGKKFEPILNDRYGVCNFSAFVRFIVPRDFQHRYLSFIRYKSDDTLTKQTQKQIDILIEQYNKKQKQIAQIWLRCDKQMFFRNFCLPKECCIRVEKLGQIFSTRESKILLQRLDPHNKGEILLQALV